MTRIVFVLLYGFVPIVAELTVTPRDTEVMVGQLVRLLCSTSNPNKEIHWFHTPVGVKDKDKDLTYGYNQIHPKYEGRLLLERNFVTGVSNLVIRSVQIGDSGKYICQDETGTGDKSSAQLIVLEGPPVCQSNIRTEEVIGPNSCGIDTDKLILSCTVSHQGNVPPVLEWRKVGASNPIIEGVTYSYVENTTICNLSMRGDLSMDNTSYICQTTRAAGTQMSCVSDAVKILYALNSSSVTDKLINDKVYCSANSSQSCSYKWKYYHEGVEKTLESGRNQTLKDVGLYRCEAQCKIKQKPCIISASLVLVIPSLTNTEPRFFKVAFIVVSVLLIACVVLIAVHIGSEHRKRYRTPLVKEGKNVPADVSSMENEGRLPSTGNYAMPCATSYTYATIDDRLVADNKILPEDYSIPAPRVQLSEHNYEGLNS